MSVAVVVPNWNGRRWLEGCLGSLAAQTEPPDEVLVVDNGSTDGSLEQLERDHPGVRVLALGHNTGFAVAANRGIAAVSAPHVALVNTDVVLARDWLAGMRAALDADPGAAAVACKMVDLEHPDEIYDAGDVLRRDGVCEQRGRFQRDDGRFDRPGEIFAACAGAALYRRDAFLAAGGFDERFFAYLEDVDLGLRLRLAGWRCRYEPRAVARHAGEGSAGGLPRTVQWWVARNTVLLVAKAFPARWLALVAYRQLGWSWHALRAGRLRAHLSGVLAAVPLLPAMLRERRRLRRSAVVAVDIVVPAARVRQPRRMRARIAARKRSSE